MHFLDSRSLPQGFQQQQRAISIFPHQNTVDHENSWTCVNHVSEKHPVEYEVLKTCLNNYPIRCAYAKRHLSKYPTKHKWLRADWRNPLIDVDFEPPHE